MTGSLRAWSRTMRATSRTRSGEPSDDPPNLRILMLPPQYIRQAHLLEHTAVMNTLLREILTSRVYEVARETPLDAAPRLSSRLDNDVLLKREDLQPIFSFKLRGAYNRIARLPPAERARGVIAASAGNHAQGVAFSAQRLGLRAVIVMPRTTPEIKVDAVRALGAEVVLAGDRYAEAQRHSEQLAATIGLAFVH